MEATILPPWGTLESKTQDQAGLGRLGFLLRISAHSAWKVALFQCLGVYTPLTEVQNSPQVADQEKCPASGQAS